MERKKSTPPIPHFQRERDRRTVLEKHERQNTGGEGGQVDKCRGTLYFIHSHVTACMGPRTVIRKESRSFAA